MGGRTACWWLTVAVFCVALVGPVSAASAASPEIPGKTITASFSAGKPAPPRITCTAAILIDQETGKILFSHNANARLPMASTTKIMTAMIVLETLDLDAEVKISASAVSTIGSKAALQRGEVLTVEELLKAMLIVSGNDASIALAETAGGSVKAFVELMNAKAEELGLTNTHFVNTCGLHDQKHFSSAKDLATLAQYALENPVFSRIVDTIYFSLPPLSGGQKRDFDNQNELLKRVPWVTGIKTGSTPYAKYCLVASGTFDGVSLVAVILGAEESEIRFEEARSLLEYGIGQYSRTLLVDRGEFVAEVDASDPLGRQVRLVAAEPLVMRLSEDDVVTGTVTLDRTPVTPVHAGDRFGTMEFTLDGHDVGSVDLIAALPVERPPFQMILDRWDHLKPPLLRSSS